MKSSGNYLSFEDFIKGAVVFEQESAEYYHRMLGYDLKDTVREVVVSLEKDEWSHKAILQKRTGAGIQGYIQFPPGFSQEMPVMEADNPTVAELLSVAIDREMKSKDMYEKSASFASGELRELLEELATFENNHEYLLRSMKDYLA
ncbi:MAG: hypothetical protein ABIJ86_11975 [Spirochaetota bacterium]